MIPITTVFMGCINQLVTGGPHIVVDLPSSNVPHSKKCHVESHCGDVIKVCMATDYCSRETIYELDWQLICRHTYECIYIYIHKCEYIYILIYKINMHNIIYIYMY